MHSWRKIRALTDKSRNRLALLVGLVALSAVTAGSPAQAGAAPAVSPVVGSGALATTVPLVTGDQVVVTSTSDGQPSYLARSAAGGGIESYQGANGDHFIVPAVAKPYLGRQLDPSLFDVSALVRAGIDTAARIPVELTFADGVQPTAPSGVTLTSVDGTSATGYLTADSGRAFADALRARTGADAAAGRKPGAGSLFGGLTAMRPAAAPQAAAQPRYPLHILQINATDPEGQPATTGVVLFNTDDFTRVATVVAVTNGVGRIAVPAGNYSAFVGFDRYDTQGDLVDRHSVTLTDFTVADTPDVTTMSLDGRSATSRVSVSTPRPTIQGMAEVSYTRQDLTGKTLVVAVATDDAPVYVNAQPAAKVGRLHYVVQWAAQSPDAADAYRYDVAFPFDNVPADETFVVKPDQLAVVHQRFFADPASPSNKGGFYSGAIDAFSARNGTILLPAPVQQMPGNLTEYVDTSNGGQWVQSVQLPDGNIDYADIRTFKAGHEYSFEWGHGPLGAVFGRHTDEQICAACTAGSALALNFEALGDSEPDHRLPWLWRGTSSNFTLYRDGTKLADLGTGYTGVKVQDLPTTPATYRATYEQDRSGTPGVSQSTVGRTEVTVKYSPTPTPGSALPATSTCYGQSESTPCQILPVLTLGYQLASDQTNTSDLRVQTMGVRVEHLSYDGAGSRAPITSVTTEVSFDGGTTWQPARVSGAAGRYTAVWTNPDSARGTSPAIRVTATDAIGGSIIQTISNAYTIAKSTH